MFFTKTSLSVPVFFLLSKMQFSYCAIIFLNFFNEVCMIGAIVGDIVGSPYEHNNYKAKDFPLFRRKSRATDDSIMSLAICDALLKFNGDYDLLRKETITSLKNIGRDYPDCGFGTSFKKWVHSENSEPYNSWGNGSAMRVSGCAYVGNTIEEVKLLSKAVTEVTHNHPEGIKGAEAVAVCIFLARQGKSKDEIKEYVLKNYYLLDFTIDEIRDDYCFDVSCQGSVPQALQAFFESTDFEDSIRTAISIGGDSDTIAAITGSVAEAYYGVPLEMREEAESFLDNRLYGILNRFEERYPGKIIE